jgi:prevent-host-death family protein
MTKRLALSAAKARLSEVVRGVRRTGEPLVLTVDGEPAATIGPVASEPRRLTAREVAAHQALADAIFRIPRPEGPFDAVALVRQGRR